MWLKTSEKCFVFSITSFTIGSFKGLIFKFEQYSIRFSFRKMYVRKIEYFNTNLLETLSPFLSFIGQIVNNVAL